MAPIRAFLAVEISDSVRARLVNVQNGLKRSGADVRWVEARNLHFTVKFLGSVEEQALETLKPLIREEVRRHPSFDLEISGAGVFLPRVVWVGLSEGTEGLRRLAQACEQAALSIGVPKENRPFSPHLTIGRMKSPKNSPPLLSLLEARRSEAWGRSPVTEVVLFRSDLQPAGPVYTALERFTLRS